MSTVSNYKEDYLDVLDLLRGLMAFWVYFSHVTLDCVGKMLPWGAGSLAVDVFMLISGFLMSYHWVLREKRILDFLTLTKDFYIRRFFRIAPLYYLLLTVAYIGQDFFFKTREYVKGAVPPPWAEQALNFHSPTDPTITVQSILSHFSFTFGFFPQYAANNILPDWSIGLEMQFYLLFPFIMLLLARFGKFFVVGLAIILAVLTNKLVGLYLVAKAFGNYPQPSLILFKINIFVGGICLAYAYFNKKDQKKLILWLVLALMALFQTAIQVKICAAFLIIMLLLRANVSHPFGKFLGDTSYSVYLLHDLLLFPALYFLFHQTWFTELSPKLRLLCACGLITPVVYSLSYLLFRFIELPGIKWGRSVLDRMNRKVTIS